MYVLKKTALVLSFLLSGFVITFGTVWLGSAQRQKEYAAEQQASVFALDDFAYGPSGTYGFPMGAYSYNGSRQNFGSQIHIFPLLVDVLFWALITYGLWKLLMKIGKKA